MVRIAVSLYPEHAEYRDIRAAAQRAEEEGVDVLYTWDHFFPLMGDPGGKHFECWTLLAAFAEVTESIPIGPMVSCNTYRNPELLADMARTVDHISGGRVIFGIGSGWFERDYEEYGYEFGTALERLQALEAALPRIKSRFASLNPAPMGRMPILIGGGGEKVTLRLVAQYADIWHGFARQAGKRDAVEQVRHKNAVLDKWCREIGRDPGEIERSIGMEADQIELADAVYEIGTHEILLGVDGPAYDFGAVREWLAWRDGKNAA